MPAPLATIRSAADLGQDAFGIDEAEPSCPGRHHATAVPLEQWSLQFAFEVLNPAGHGRLRDVQVARRSPDAAETDNPQKRLQLPRIHAPIRKTYASPCPDFIFLRLGSAASSAQSLDGDARHAQVSSVCHPRRHNRPSDLRHLPRRSGLASLRAGQGRTKYPTLSSTTVKIATDGESPPFSSAIRPISTS